jgi:hypothetical protein
LPDLEHAKAAVLNSLNSADAKRGYRHAIDEFVDWYCSEMRLAFNRIVVLRYRCHLESRQLAPGTINLRLGAVRRLTYEAADCGLLSADLAAGIRRVKRVASTGVARQTMHQQALGPPRHSKSPPKSRQLSCVTSLNTMRSATLRLSVMTISAALFQDLTNANKSS